MYRVMFDASVFNFIHIHDLYSEIETFFQKNKAIRVYVTPTQIDEVNAISDVAKRDSINGLLQTISVVKVPASFGVAGLDQPSPHSFGYKGPRVGGFRVADFNENNKDDMEKFRGPVDTNPLGRDIADKTILDTAVTEHMDYLVTADKTMNSRQLEQLKKVRIYSQEHPELKIELLDKKEDLIGFLNTYCSS
jgi:predicted nucleic acid-binding protein